MTIEAGTKLGPYEIVAPLGAGGMGEVYRARDTRLNREVAVKVLPAHLAESPELRQRFEREAKAISQLSHPHICTLYDVGNDDGVEYLVMELLDGESLAERLTQGALPADQVVRYGIEIADALEAAHKHGIVHRDLKPGNVMLTKSGVKLLDFGLAKHWAATAQSEIEALTSLATEMSPSQPLTTQGTIMGTFQYMAPEQLEGEETDERGDIFALGCVLYEMATGKKAFTGKSRASLIGSILKEEPPPISSIEAMTPPALDRLVSTCIAKDPEDRFQTAHDVKLQLQWIAEGGSQVGAPAVVSARRKSRERLWITLAGVFALLAIAAGVAWWMRAPEEPRITRFNILPPAAVTTVGAPRISPDGRYIAFSGTGDDGTPRIWLRAMDDLEAHPLAGTDGAQYRPFWSPDSRYIGFIAAGKLKKVPVSGGPPQVVCDAPTGADGAWSSKGVILFDGAGSDPIRRVSASGGVSTPIIESKSGNNGYSVGWPAFLPDGEHFLYFQFATSGDSKELMLASLDGKEAPRKLLP
ncbi:MAG TPA: protein kinase, partial [Thermoanaerobaculia bacterium]|nr:protein kinase [Thermoanaerobaculia bacterium]